jgi:AcrR family transcriptional regulator
MSHDTSHEEAQPGKVLRARHRIGVDDPAAEGQTARGRIQDVALTLFIEEGYDKTSLREIAEKLGVTKAALYYHFPTKEDIITSLLSDRIAHVEALIAWAEQQPRGPEMRREFVRRYAEMLASGKHYKVLQFFERNPTIAKSIRSGETMHAQMNQVMDLLSDPTEPHDVQLRRSVAIFALHASSFVFKARDVPEPDGREAALKVALDLVS